MAWSISKLRRKSWKHTKNYESLEILKKPTFKFSSLINADFAAGAVLISLGGILGVSSPFQLTVMVLIEVFLYSLNEYIGAEIFKAIDVGGSMFIHAFGAYFGYFNLILFTFKWKCQKQTTTLQ